MMNAFDFGGFGSFGASILDMEQVNVHRYEDD